MEEWFTIDKIDEQTYCISEYRHWEETHCYLLLGNIYCLLIDTGLGIQNIHEIIRSLTDQPILCIATHIHWDHIGGHRYFHNIYVHEEELSWLQGEFPLPLQVVKKMVMERCDLPDDFNIQSYEIFQGKPSGLLKGNEIIDLGGRSLQVLHTPGHSPGHMCFWEEEKRYLFTGDLVYKDMLFAYYPSTDPQAYLSSLERIAGLDFQKILSAHHSLDIDPSIVKDMRDEFQKLDHEGNLHHGSGKFYFKDWSLWL